MFGTFRTSQATGLLLAHKLVANGRVYKKGHRLQTEDTDHLSSVRIDEIVARRIEDDELDEDMAAHDLASLLATETIDIKPAEGGRLNLYSRVAGLFIADAALVDLLNSVDHAITLCCLSSHVRVDAGDMIATLKIIPLAVSRAAVEAVCKLAAISPAVSVLAFLPHSVSLISTTLPHIRDGVMDKTREVTAARIAERGSELISETRPPHNAGAIAEVLSAEASKGVPGKHLVLIFGATAVVDGDDVIPSAIRSADGHVDRIGMPVDPGNLLVFGRLGATTVIGAPGCARSTSRNGLDMILDRIFAGDKLGGSEIARMGVGGLLHAAKERSTRRVAFSRLGGVDRPVATESSYY